MTYTLGTLRWLPLVALVAACGPVDSMTIDGAPAGDGASMGADSIAPTNNDAATMPPQTDAGTMDTGTVVPPTDAGTTPPRADASVPGADAAPMGRIAIDTPAPGDPATRTRTDVCGVWNSAVARAQTAGRFTAGAMMCAPGSLPQNAVDAAVLMTNVYRYLAGLPNVGEAADQTRAAQACAELMEANRQLSHMPPMSWTCYTALGAMGAARSNITSGPGTPVGSLAGWVDDSRDISGTLGHRRWILFPQLGPIGYGQAARYACQYVLGPRGTGRKTWVAWPNEGVTPMEAMSQIWSFSSASLGVTNSTRVTVTRDGAPLAVAAMLRANGYGDPTVSWNMPAGAVTAGAVFRVTVTGLTGGMTVNYDVRPERCGG